MVDLDDRFASSGSIRFEGVYEFGDNGPGDFLQAWTVSTGPAEATVDSADG